MSIKIRHAAWAGQFYPARPEHLEQTINDYLGSAPAAQHDGRILGLIAPHAGYIYSGKTAAAAYRQILHESYQTVVLLSPSHAALIDGVSVFNGDFYETPLGKVAVDARAARLAEHNLRITLGTLGHIGAGERAEHALEVQLPFLQVTLSRFSIVPVVFHDNSWENCRQLGDAVVETFDPATTLIVASSDLYHGSSYDQCLRQDALTLRSIENDDAKKFCELALKDEVMACGAGPITVLKYVTEKWGAQRPRIITRTNSADAVGNEHGYVVGYAAAIVVK
jgi:MEMO1 family protein